MRELARAFPTTWQEIQAYKQNAPLRVKNQGTIARVRQWLNGIGVEKFPIAFQGCFGVILLWTILGASYESGSFPPKPPEEPLLLAASYAAVGWCALAAIASAGVLLKKRWGWWLEFIFLIPFPIAAIAYWAQFKASDMETIRDYRNLFESIAHTVGAFWVTIACFNRARINDQEAP